MNLCAKKTKTSADLWQRSKKNDIFNKNYAMGSVQMSLL
jgi:hypothetical protein